MRMSSLKMMALMFGVFDRSTYQRIIPHHLADIKKYPNGILKCLVRGIYIQHKWTKVACSST